MTSDVFDYSSALIIRIFNFLLILIIESCPSYVLLHLHYVGMLVCNSRHGIVINCPIFQLNYWSVFSYRISCLRYISMTTNWRGHVVVPLYIHAFFGAYCTAARVLSDSRVICSFLLFTSDVWNYLTSGESELLHFRLLGVNQLLWLCFEQPCNTELIFIFFYYSRKYNFFRKRTNFNIFFIW